MNCLSSLLQERSQEKEHNVRMQVTEKYEYTQVISHWIKTKWQIPTNLPRKTTFEPLLDTISNEFPPSRYFPAGHALVNEIPRFQVTSRETHYQHSGKGVRSRGLIYVGSESCGCRGSRLPRNPQRRVNTRRGLKCNAHVARKHTHRSLPVAALRTLEDSPAKGGGDRRGDFTTAARSLLTRDSRVPPALKPEYTGCLTNPGTTADLGRWSG